jgi:hypothetical protein
LVTQKIGYPKELAYNSAFDLLKNKGLDKTIFAVLCWIHEMSIGLNKISGKTEDENNNFCPSLNHGTTFYP